MHVCKLFESARVPEVKRLLAYSDEEKSIECQLDALTKRDDLLFTLLALDEILHFSVVLELRVSWLISRLGRRIAIGLEVLILEVVQLGVILLLKEVAHAFALAHFRLDRGNWHFLLLSQLAQPRLILLINGHILFCFIMILSHSFLIYNVGGNLIAR